MHEMPLGEVSQTGMLATCKGRGIWEPAEELLGDLFFELKRPLEAKKFERRPCHLVNKTMLAAPNPVRRQSVQMVYA